MIALCLERASIRLSSVGGPNVVRMRTTHSSNGGNRKNSNGTAGTLETLGALASVLFHLAL